MKYILSLTLLISFFQISLFAQTDSTIAKVGNENITAKQFINRFELMPQVYSKENNPYTKKQDLLYSIIAEKLWAQQAEKMGMDTTELMQTTFKALENMFVRDALYKIEIGNKVQISDKELQTNLKRYFENLNLSVIFSPDSEKIFQFYNDMKKGAAFDSLYLLNKIKLPPIDVTYGDMDPQAEDAVYQLKKDEHTKPLKSNTGWFIFKLNKKTERDHIQENIDEVLKKVKQKIEERKSGIYYDKFMNQFFKDKNVTTNGALFWSIADKIIADMQRTKRVEKIPDTSNVYLSNKDVLGIEKQFGADSLDMNFINFDKNPISVRQFLRLFAFQGFYSKDVSSKVLAAKLNGRVKTTIENELIAREGYKRGLENLPSVRADLAMWKDNYLAQLMKQKLLDSVHVTDDEAREIYNKINKQKMANSTEVNVLEILTDSLDVVQEVLKDLKKGANFRTLAKIHTKRKWTRAKGGEFGFFPSSMYGNIGKKAAELKIGEVYGPIKTPEGYSIIKLIGKKEDKVNLESFEKEKKQIKQQLFGDKSSKFIINYTVKLANKYGVKINNDLLNSIQPKDLSMYVYRYMGFGGRITAVPFTLPFIEWYKPWKDGEKIVP